MSDCLVRISATADIQLEKPRRAANYEVDGVVQAPGAPVLIEIKTGVSAADVYAGVGQLTLYPIVLKDLAKHGRIPLLLRRPGRELVMVLGRCGVELQSYELKRGRRSATARFGAALLRRCGIAEKTVVQLVARGEAIA